MHNNEKLPDPGTCDSGMRDYTNRTSQSLMEDIPDVEAYERDFETGSTSAFPLLSANNFDSSGVLPERDIHKIPNVQYNIGINRQITPKQEILDDDTSMIACTGPSTKIIQRSGIKMEVPPYLDPDSKDDDPEDGVVYPEPNLFDVKNTNMSEYDLEVLKLGKEVVDEARGKIDAPDASAPPNKIVEYLMFYRTLKESELIQLNAYRTKRNRLSLNLVKNNVDREFDQKACESLVKKLKDKKQDLQNLIDVVVTKGKSYTGCITIPRTLDGRLQVHGRKGFPHVVYGKLWRFSEMTKNETRNVEHCNHAFEMKSDLVCVNPYHYEQVIGTMIVGQRDNSDLRDIQSHSSVQQSYQPTSSMNMNMNMNQVPGSMHQNGFNMPNMNMMPTNLQSNMNPRRQPNIMQDPTLQQNVHQQKMHPPVPAMRPGCVPPYGMHQTLLHASKMQSPMGHSPNIPQSAVAAPPQMMSMPSSIAPNVPMHHPIHTSMTYGNQAPTVPGNVNFNQHMPYTPMDYHLGPSTSTHHTQGFDDFDDQQMMDFAQWANRDMNLYTFSNAYPQHVPPPVPTSESTSESIIALSRFRRFCKKVFGNRFYEGEFEDEPEPPLTAGIQYIETRRTSVLGVQVVRRRLADGATIDGPVPYEAPYHDICKFILRLTAESLIISAKEPDSRAECANWGTVVYYEQAQQVGEKKCTSSNFFVDGGFIASEYRYSLGLEPNPTRSPSAFKIRQSIFEGVRFSFKDDGSVWLQNYMAFPVFVTSGYLDEQGGGVDPDKVHKLYGCSKLKVFGFDVVRDYIRDALFSKQMATMFLRGHPTPMDSIYRKKKLVELQKEASRTSDSLQRFCCVRVSFCKGFGAAYRTRPDITSCPVWIELKVNGAYDYMDAILTDLGNRYDPMGIEEFAKLGINVSED